MEQHPPTTKLHQAIVKVLQQVYDPELPIDIYALGLIYDIRIEAATGKVEIIMTLTTPACPAAETLPEEVRTAVEGVEGVEEAVVTLTFDPPYSMERLSPDAKAILSVW